MGAGLWRHASLSFRQLEVRSPNDTEVKRGLALAALATGKLAQAEASLGQGAGESDNARFVAAVLALGKGSREKAAGIFRDLAGHNEYAKLILDFWSAKETKE
jgi:hypothetical protein